MASISELKARLSKPEITIEMLPVNEKQKIIHLHYNEDRCKVFIELENYIYQFSLSYLSEAELKTLTCFYKVHTYGKAHIRWFGVDQKVMNVLNKSPYVHIEDIDSHETFVVNSCSPNYGCSMEIESDKFILQYRTNFPINNAEANLLTGEKFTVKKGILEWL